MIRSRVDRSNAIVDFRCSFQDGVWTEISVKEFFAEPRYTNRCPQKDFVAWAEHNNSTLRINVDFSLVLNGSSVGAGDFTAAGDASGELFRER